MRIPEPGDVYERWDGELVLVAGLTLDDQGTLCVEIETKDAPADLIGMGEWLGVARDAAHIYPPPRRFTFIEADQDPLVVTRDDLPDPPRSAKVAVLESALKHSEGDGQPVTVRPSDED